MTAKIRMLASVDDTHLAPYVGWIFKVKRKGKHKSSIVVFGRVDSGIDNKYLKFCKSKKPIKSK